MALLDRQDRSVLYGALIITGLVVLAVGLFALDGLVARFKDPDRIYAVLPNAPKLAAGARVWIGGKDVGEVTEVALVPFTVLLEALALFVLGNVKIEFHDHRAVVAEGAFEFVDLLVSALPFFFGRK